MCEVMFMIMFMLTLSDFIISMNSETKDRYRHHMEMIFSPKTSSDHTQKLINTKL